MNQWGVGVGGACAQPMDFSALWATDRVSPFTTSRRGEVNSASSSLFFFRTFESHHFIGRAAALLYARAAAVLLALRVVLQVSPDAGRQALTL